MKGPSPLCCSSPPPSPLLVVSSGPLPCFLEPCLFFKHFVVFLFLLFVLHIPFFHVLFPLCYPPPLPFPPPSQPLPRLPPPPPSSDAAVNNNRRQRTRSADGNSKGKSKTRSTTVESSAVSDKPAPRFVHEFPAPNYGARSPYDGVWNGPIDPRSLLLPNLTFRMVRPPKTWPKNRHIFHVPMKMNKLMVKHYLEQLYRVEVVKVEIAIIEGRRYINYFGGKPRQLKFSDTKRAIVITKEPFKFPNWLEVRQLEKEAEKNKQTSQ